ncbi:hypothetical protein [Streptomyces sp. BPSDS2]|uniref:hypothetical protein n=1 Tax=Streptomyces sp. BPSDS2 TaxID=2571021 RepID=UPI0010C16703|nr:hypothetical protein [Streptomyces sp. BPSDS2]
MSAAVCALVGAVSEETLTDYGFTRRTDVHRAARCAELWAVERRRRDDREALDRHQGQEVTR